MGFIRNHDVCRPVIRHRVHIVWEASTPLLNKSIKHGILFPYFLCNEAVVRCLRVQINYILLDNVEDLWKPHHDNDKARKVLENK